ncbi:MAG: hypothetical protein JO023_26755 [Chloroflexi bacterium]|nr:hypothetical protein [Chloroflexota bacterium]
MVERERAGRDRFAEQAPAESRWSYRRRAVAIALVGVPLVILIALTLGGFVLATLVPAVRGAYIRDIRETGKEPAFLLTLAFLITFGLVRFITYSIRTQRLRLFRNVTTKSGLHVHHMVPGMLLVLASGYFGLVLPGSAATPLLAILFGIGAALVLDEFALWLRLADVYWEPEGRESIDAVVLAGGVCLLYLLGLGFWPRLIEAVLRRLS